MFVRTSACATTSLFAVLPPACSAAPKSSCRRSSSVMPSYKLHPPRLSSPPLLYVLRLGNPGVSCLDLMPEWAPGAWPAAPICRVGASRRDEIGFMEAAFLPSCTRLNLASIEFPEPGLLAVVGVLDAAAGASILDCTCYRAPGQGAMAPLPALGRPTPSKPTGTPLP